MAFGQHEAGFGQKPGCAKPIATPNRLGRFMRWLPIAASVVGTGHAALGLPCQDAHMLAHVQQGSQAPTLVCCISDGAGSASQAQWAASHVVRRMAEELVAIVGNDIRIREGDVLALVEQLADELNEEAARQLLPVYEFSCTLLGGVLAPDHSVFFQLGDGAMVRADGAGHYVPVWMPQNGEYVNETHFVADADAPAHVQVLLLNEPMQEVALFTDGLQHLALNFEDHTAHQPFFKSMFLPLQNTDSIEARIELQEQLANFLNSNAINSRTDDDKTLVLARRLP